MGYHDGLLAHARELIEGDGSTQVALRRSVSASYYALFHLLIEESAANWNQAQLRDKLARSYDHGQMKQASIQVESWKSEDPVLPLLKEVATAFRRLQQLRNRADYDNAHPWNATSAADALETAENAFAAWNSIRNEPLAQEYLLMLLARGRDR